VLCRQVREISIGHFLRDLRFRVQGSQVVRAEEAQAESELRGIPGSELHRDRAGSQVVGLPEGERLASVHACELQAQAAQFEQGEPGKSVRIERSPAPLLVSLAVNQTDFRLASANNSARLYSLYRSRRADSRSWRVSEVPAITWSSRKFNRRNRSSNASKV